MHYILHRQIVTSRKLQINSLRGVANVILSMTITQRRMSLEYSYPCLINMGLLIRMEYIKLLDG